MDKIILAIESSCDETSIVILKNDSELLANVISTQIEVHKKYELIDRVNNQFDKNIKTRW